MKKTTKLHEHGNVLNGSNRRDENVSEYSISEMVRVFQALSDLTRAKVVYALTHGEQSVNELATRVGASPSAVSHHLRRLKDAGLVTFHRHGNQVFYSVEDVHVAAILREARNHIDHTRMGT